MNAWNGGGGYNPYAMGSGGGGLYGYQDPNAELYHKETGKTALSPYTANTVFVDGLCEKYALEQAEDAGPKLAVLGGVVGGGIALATLPVTWPFLLAGAALGGIGASIAGTNLVKFKARADFKAQDLADDGQYNGSVEYSKTRNEQAEFWKQRQEKQAQAASHQAPGSSLGAQTA